MAWNRLRAKALAGIAAALLGACVAPVGQDSSATPTGSAASTPSGTIPLTTSALAGTVWTAFAIEGVPEVVQPKPTLQWNRLLHFSGSGGCNAFGGAFFLEKDSVRIGPLVRRGQACLTLPGAQEDKFFSALEGTRAAHLEGDQLVLLDEAGHQLARLLKNP